MRYARPAKGAVALVVATAVCHGIMSAGLASVGASADGAGTVGAGAVEFLFTLAASWVLMPLLLHVAMQMMGEDGNVALVVLGGLVWCGISGYFTDAVDRQGGHIPVPALAAYLLVGTALAAIGPARSD
ncbi:MULTISPECIES: hypothetical protein [unclassified Streptomyces]|uniref:hypothetical protein n=1 Tax=unclassified Streptomyces TaxID=2593676 RepID=UPI001ED9E22B|nr:MULTISPECIES: hypothetical protein [unclassified Streptomyces]UKL05857.1 hypothetical protein L2I08_24360 [Streptomyces sp. NBU3104]